MLVHIPMFPVEVNHQVVLCPCGTWRINGQSLNSFSVNSLTVVSLPFLYLLSAHFPFMSGIFFLFSYSLMFKYSQFILISKEFTFCRKFNIFISLGSVFIFIQWTSRSIIMLEQRRSDKHGNSGTLATRVVHLNRRYSILV